MVLIPSPASKSTGKYCLMKHCRVTLPFPILKSKGKYCMAEKPSHVSRVSLSYPVEIGLRPPPGTSIKMSQKIASRVLWRFFMSKNKKCLVLDFLNGKY